ncbi:MAG: hypothetical protein CM15mP32_1800 [Flavobacteriaceae bacterium]|nr:MAG: hypothetical protein CM15mP32_1800 [Flavobacteriaceae bacterium]
MQRLLKPWGGLGFCFCVSSAVGFQLSQTPLSIQNNVPSSYGSEELECLHNTSFRKQIQLHEKLAQNDSVVVKINYSNKQIFGLPRKRFKSNIDILPPISKIIFWFALELYGLWVI